MQWCMLYAGWVPRFLNSDCTSWPGAKRWKDLWSSSLVSDQKLVPGVGLGCILGLWYK